MIILRKRCLWCLWQISRLLKEPRCVCPFYSQGHWGRIQHVVKWIQSKDISDPEKLSWIQYVSFFHTQLIKREAHRCIIEFLVFGHFWLWVAGVCQPAGGCGLCQPKRFSQQLNSANPCCFHLIRQNHPPSSYFSFENTLLLEKLIHIKMHTICIWYLAVNSAICIQLLPYEHAGNGQYYIKSNVLHFILIVHNFSFVSFPCNTMQ